MNKIFLKKRNIVLIGIGMIVLSASVVFLLLYNTKKDPAEPEDTSVQQSSEKSDGIELTNPATNEQQALLDEARDAAKNNQVSLAVNKLEQAVKEGQNNPDVLTEAAKIYISLSKIDTAEDLLNQARVIYRSQESDKGVASVDQLFASINKKANDQRPTNSQSIEVTPLNP